MPDDTQTETVRNRSIEEIAKRIHTFTNEIVPLLGDLAKIGAFVSVPFGLLLFYMYLASVGVPLPELGTSLWALLSVLTIIFTFVTVLLCSSILLPAHSRTFFPPQPWPDNSAKTFAKTRYLAYALMYGPFLSCALASLICVSLEALVPASLVGWLMLVLTGIFILVWTRLAKGKVARSDAVLWSLSSAVWFLLLLLLPSTTGQDRGYLPWMVAFLILHVTIVRFVDSWRRMVAAYLSLGLIACVTWPGAAFLGGATLKALGLGGGIPVTIRVKVVPPNRSDAVAIDQSGCLLLALGADVYFAPKAISKKSDCHTEPNSLLHPSAWPLPYEQCIRYARTDVLSITKAPY
jgi:hypothetical protein